jgi:hypothetical protein
VAARRGAAASSQPPAVRAASAGRHLGPSFSGQFSALCRLLLLQQLRSAWPEAVLYALLLAAASFGLGYSHSLQWAVSSTPSQMAALVACMALLTALHELQSSANARAKQLLLQGQAGVHVRTSAVLLARLVSGLPWLLLAPAILTLPYYYVVGLQMNIFAMYGVLALVCCCAASIAALISLLSSSTGGTMAAVVLALLAPLALLQDRTMPALAGASLPHWYLTSFNYGHWGAEALALLEFQAHRRGWSNVIVVTGRRWDMCGLQASSLGGAGEARQDPQLFLEQEQLVRGAEEWPCQGHAYRAMAFLAGCALLMQVLAAVWVGSRLRK